jgi:hypothetical protein
VPTSSASSSSKDPASGPAGTKVAVPTSSASSSSKDPAEPQGVHVVPKGKAKAKGKKQKKDSTRAPLVAAVAAPSADAGMDPAPLVPSVAAPSVDAAAEQAPEAEAVAVPAHPPAQAAAIAAPSVHVAASPGAEAPAVAGPSADVDADPAAQAAEDPAPSWAMRVATKRKWPRQRDQLPEGLDTGKLEGTYVGLLFYLPDAAMPTETPNGKQGYTMYSLAEHNDATVQVLLKKLSYFIVCDSNGKVPAKQTYSFGADPVAKWKEVMELTLFDVVN